MQVSFNVGDRATIQPRYAHHYPSDSGVIVAVQLDESRPAFNEYTVKFPDGSKANLFEFQMVEAAPLNDLL